MMKSMKFATALAGAAVVVVGGTAFTANNEMPLDTYAGYGSSSVTGVTVSGVEYTFDGSGATAKFVSADFTIDEDLTGLDPVPTASSNLTGAAAAMIGSDTECDTSVAFHITCTYVGNPAPGPGANAMLVTDVTDVNLTVQ